MSYALFSMARFGQQNRNLQRRETRAQTIVSKSLFVKPESDCVEARQVVELEDPDFLLSQRLVTHNEKLVEYALVLSRLQGGEWVEVYSIDTQHGTLHEHISGHKRKNDRRDIRPLYTQVDVQESIDEPAMQLVFEKYRKMRG